MSLWVKGERVTPKKASRNKTDEWGNSVALGNSKLRKPADKFPDQLGRLSQIYPRRKGPTFQS